MTTAEHEHLYALADEVGVSLHIGALPPALGVASWGAYDHASRTAYAVPGRRAYIVALHELGHAIVGTSERRAWAWAVTHSARPFTDDERTFASRCLASYGA